MIEITYNGNSNLPLERNHKSKQGIHILTRIFESIEDAIFFWLECEFYSGAITPLEEILPKGYTHPLLECIEEPTIQLEDVLLSDQKLAYQLEEEEW